MKEVLSNLLLELKISLDPSISKSDSSEATMM